MRRRRIIRGEQQGYPYAPFAGYSPLIVVDAKGLGVSTDNPVMSALRINNNARNLQIPVDTSGFNITVSWEK
jgi:hypothetical protein